jgi:hypothetical protein
MDVMICRMRSMRDVDWLSESNADLFYYRFNLFAFNPHCSFAFLFLAIRFIVLLAVLLSIPVYNNVHNSL